MSITNWLERRRNRGGVDKSDPFPGVAKKTVTEGTWSAPQTLDQAKKLVALLKKPLLASQATDKLYDLIDDDSLFDSIGDAKKEDPTTDVRGLVKDKLRKWLKDLDAGQKQWNWHGEWEPEALELLKKNIK